LSLSKKESSSYSPTLHSQAVKKFSYMGSKKGEKDDA